MHARALIRRWHSPTLFTLVGLCFLLPFATVSCGDAETSFNGAQLATWSVPEGGFVEGRDLAAHVEDEASALAVTTLSVATLGFALGVLSRRGGGWCAAVGIGSMLLMAWPAVDLYGPDVTFHEGYTFTLLLLVWAAVLRGVRTWRRRKRSEPYWTAQRAQEKLRSGITR